jgi:tetratricopeptide (TPR) repeat protein
VPAFAEAVRVDPPSAERHEFFAKVLYQLDRLDDAVTQARAALALDPTRLESRMLIYSAQARRGAWVDAKAELEAALEVAPDNLSVLEQLAVVANEQDDQMAAVQAYERITAIDPQRSEAWIALGGLYARVGEPQKAQDAYQRVAAQNPEGAYQVFYNLGALIMNRSQRSTTEVRQAVDAFNRAIEIRADFAPAHRQLGLALLELGDRAGARAALERFIELEPEGPDVVQLRAIVQALPR